MRFYSQGYRTVFNGQKSKVPNSLYRTRRVQALAIVGCFSAGYYYWNLEAVPITSLMLNLKKIRAKEVQWSLGSG